MSETPDPPFEKYAADSEMLATLKPFYSLDPILAEPTSPLTKYVDCIIRARALVDNEVGSVIEFFLQSDDRKSRELTVILEEARQLFEDPTAYELPEGIPWESELERLLNSLSKSIVEVFTAHRHARWEPKPASLDAEIDAILVKSWELFEDFLWRAESLLSVWHDKDLWEFDLCRSYRNAKFNLGWAIGDLAHLLMPPIDESTRKVIDAKINSRAAWMRNQLLNEPDPTYSKQPAAIKRWFKNRNSFNSTKSREKAKLIEAGHLTE